MNCAIRATCFRLAGKCKKKKKKNLFSPIFQPPSFGTTVWAWLVDVDDRPSQSTIKEKPTTTTTTTTTSQSIYIFIYMARLTSITKTWLALKESASRLAAAIQRTPNIYTHLSAGNVLMGWRRRLIINDPCCCRVNG